MAEIQRFRQFFCSGKGRGSACGSLDEVFFLGGFGILSVSGGESAQRPYHNKNGGEHGGQNR